MICRRRTTISKTITGQTQSLKPAQRHALERIYRRSVPTQEIITRELAQFMAEISAELNRQVGVIIDRRGRIQHVILGDHDHVFLPDLGRHRAGQGRLRGLRLVHTHVLGEPLNTDDITDLAKLQLDLVAVLQVNAQAQAESIEIAHLIPPDDEGLSWRVLEPEPFQSFEFRFLDFIDELDVSLSRITQVVHTEDGLIRAIAVHVTHQSPQSEEVQSRLDELDELARTAGVAIVERVIQRRPKPDPRYVLGHGKLQDLALSSLHHDADLVIFNQELSPSQARSIAEAVELKVIDRTQLIMDIFAQRAKSRDGKLQVELAQLRYTLPRLSGHGTSMSRLMGGVGGRGPGETKLEIDRRRAKERITSLKNQLDKLSTHRALRRARRSASKVPVAAIVGYTNAGKSTLLNTLTGSEVLSEDKLFATLDPTARRLRFPNEVEIVLTDTVGFIRDLPEALKAAFMATLEELEEADLFIHVVDISQKGWQERIHAIEQILSELEYDDIERVLVFNKIDRLEDQEAARALCAQWKAIGTSAIDKQSLSALSHHLLERLKPGAIPEWFNPELPDADEATQW